MTALCIYPTHQNCDEAQADFERVEIDAVCYPVRTTETTEKRAANCWNPEADEAEMMGFPVVATACSVCNWRRKCLESGYLAGLLEAEQASVSIATHARAEHTGLEKLTEHRTYVAIHEDPLQLLRPELEATEMDVRNFQIVLDILLTDPRWLDWFGDAVSQDENGNPVLDEERLIRRERLLHLVHHLSSVIDRLVKNFASAQQSVLWSPGASHAHATGIERLIFRACKEIGTRFSGQPWRFLIEATLGHLCSTAILVNTRRVVGKQKTKAEGCVGLKRTVVGFKNNAPAPNAATWINDATLEVDCLESLLGFQIRDCTPDGRVALQKKAVQIPRDITRGTTKNMVASIIRGILTDRPQFLRVGIIIHQLHLSVVKLLEPEYADRIVKMAYFGSGDERSSNDWHHTCDLILVLGTPRLSPMAVSKHLLRLGNIGAALSTPQWGKLTWHGLTEADVPIQVTGSGYYDATWRRAQRDLVRATLVQAIGRGRGILATGCEVIVVSTEECGLRISDTETTQINEKMAKVLAAVHQLGARFAILYLAKRAPNSAEVASHCQIGLRLTQQLLQRLEVLGQVRKVGERLGWLPVIQTADAPTQVDQSPGTSTTDRPALEMPTGGRRPDSQRYLPLKGYTLGPGKP